MIVLCCWYYSLRERTVTEYSGSDRSGSNTLRVKERHTGFLGPLRALADPSETPVYLCRLSMNEKVIVERTLYFDSFRAVSVYISRAETQHIQMALINQRGNGYYVDCYLTENSAIWKSKQMMHMSELQLTNGFRMRVFLD